MAYNVTVTEEDNPVVINVVQIIVFTTSLLGMLLNTTTIMALVHLPWCSRPNLRLLLSFCAANLIFAGNFLVYMVAVYSNPKGSGYAVTCLSFEVLRSVIYLYLYFNLASIILDLYLAVTNPLGYASIVTSERTNKLLIIIAVISVITVLLALTFNYLTITDKTIVYIHESSCSVYNTYLYIRSLNWIFKVSVFVSIPVFIVLLIIIFLAVKATNSAANAQPSNTRSVVTVMLVVTVFLVCYGPYQFISFYMQHSPDSYHRFSTVAKIFERMFYLNGFFTPLIYSLRMRDVKKGYTLMFKKCVSTAADYQSVFTGQ